MTRVSNLKKRLSDLKKIPKKKMFLTLLGTWFVWILVNCAMIAFANPRFQCLAQGSLDLKTAPQSKLSETEQTELETLIKDKNLPYRRASGDTFLTFPEWYIVFSARDYAEALQNGWPSQFRYHAVTKQYWQSYGCITPLTSTRFPAGDGSVLVLNIIGGSFSAENTFRGMHEFTAGRFSELFASQKTPEDEVGTQVAHSYAKFLETTPWYSFSFTNALKDLWFKTPILSGSPIRSFERKGFLTFEYSFKALYGKLITVATEARFDPAIPQTFLIIRTPKDKSILETLSGQKNPTTVAGTIGTDLTVLSAPRYEAFKDVVHFLAEHEVDIVEMAGNQELLLTGFTSKDWQAPEELSITPVFSMEILNHPDQDRKGYLVNVSDLTKFLPLLKESGFTIEHVFDF